MAQPIPVEHVAERAITLHSTVLPRTVVVEEVFTATVHPTQQFFRERTVVLEVEVPPVVPVVQRRHPVRDTMEVDSLPTAVVVEVVVLKQEMLAAQTMEAPEEMVGQAASQVPQ